jgi:hypothetical protein
LYYTSVDAQGDFRVGDYFLVDQQTGNVTFTNSNITIASPSGVVFTDGINTTEITPTKVETGNIRISGNTIESTTGGITLQAANGTVTSADDVSIAGDLDVVNVTVNGNTILGTNNTNTLTINAKIASNLIPNTNSVYDLGSSSLSWNNVYLSNYFSDQISISGNVIQTTVSNADLELSANGTGNISIPNNNLIVGQDLNVTSGTTSLYNATVTGNLNVNNLVTTSIISSTLSTGDILISGNVITTTQSNSNLELRANGSGYVVAENLQFNSSSIIGTVAQDINLTPSGTGIVNINSNQAVKIPVGTELQRPAIPSSGMIRFNSDTNYYEGYNGSYWIRIGGVFDVDNDTYILAETSPGANENTLYFYAGGSLSATLDANNFNVNKLVVDSTEIDGNVIRTTTTNTDLELLPNGTGTVVFDNFKFGNNIILNTGYYHIVGTNAFVIPTGTDGQRPLSPQTGMMRYNTDNNLTEIYNGTAWVSVAGTGSGITLSIAEDIALASALIFG